METACVEPEGSAMSMQRGTAQPRLLSVRSRWQISAGCAAAAVVTVTPTFPLRS